MDYMERKGSGFGTILDAYEKEAPNPRGLKPEFFSTSGSFRVVLPNLNREAGGMSGGKGAEGAHPPYEPTNGAGGPITSRFDPTNEPPATSSQCNRERENRLDAVFLAIGRRV